jgi:hypothetical protein
MERADALLRLAECVSDGRDVNWDSERIKTPELVPELRELETLARIRMTNVALTETESLRSPIPEKTGAPRPLFIWGKLEVLEWLGEGSFGEVYRAYDPALQTELALKLRKATKPGEDPGADQFLSEARRLARVRHPNVLVVYGVDTHDGRSGIWTEFIRGKTLECCLDEQGRWNAREAALAGIDICRALAAVHAAGLVHRDVKTTNVMRESGGRIVLMDFGSGGELPRRGDMGSTRHIHGTPSAMAPEQLHGKVAGPATDIYSLGVLLYRMITGSFPVEADNLPQLVERHARKERIPLRDRRSDLPTNFVEVVERAIETDPADRFQSAAEMELALARTLHGVQHDGKRRAALVTVAVLLLLAAGWIGTQWIIKQGTTSGKTVPPKAPLTATASLYRHGEGGDERLLPGTHVAPGDRLFMSLQGSDSMFVYVLDEDEAGHVYALFPLRGRSPENPLAPGVSYRLPEKAFWTITSVGGRETITAIAARTPLGTVERQFAALPQAEAGRPMEVGPEALRSLRGIGGLEPETVPEAGQAGKRVSDALRALAGRQRGPEEPWVWQAELENPKPAH